MSAHSCQPSQCSFLTLEQVDEFFKKYDKNGDGVITKDELTGVFPHLAGPSTQTKNHGSTPFAGSKALPPHKKVNSKACPTKPKEKTKANESHAHTHKVGSNILHNEPKKKFEDRAQKAPARDSQKKASSLRLSREHMKQIFREYDIDGDGFLNYDELTMALYFLASIIPFYKVHDGLTFANANRDRLISMDELDKLVDFAEKLYGEKEVV